MNEPVFTFLRHHEAEFYGGAVSVTFLLGFYLLRALASALLGRRHPPAAVAAKKTRRQELLDCLKARLGEPAGWKYAESGECVHAEDFPRMIVGTHRVSAGSRGVVLRVVVDGVDHSGDFTCAEESALLDLARDRKRDVAEREAEERARLSLTAFARRPPGPDAPEVAAARTAAPSTAAPFLVRVCGDPEVYVVSNGRRRRVPDAATFNALGYDWDSVRVLTAEEMDKIPAAQDLPRAV